MDKDETEAPFEIEIRQNNCAIPERCPACEFRFKPDIGPWPFVKDAGQAVCEDCAEYYWPEVWQACQEQRATFLAEVERIRRPTRERMDA